MNYVPPVDGSGGGIQPMEDSRILFANRMGEFGVIETNGIVNLLPFKIDMNLDALKRDPVGQLKSFNVAVGAPTTFQHMPPYETLACTWTWPMRLIPLMHKDVCRTGEICLSPA
jgi:hypothetical protein